MLDDLKHIFKESPITAILLIIGFILFFIQPLILLVIAGIIWIFTEWVPAQKHKEPQYPLASTDYRPDKSSYYPIRGNRLMSTAKRNAYLASPKWKALRQQVIQRDKVCQLSGTTTNLEVHHITYDNLGNEYLEDLVLLSRKAHQFTHDYYGSYDRNNTYPITESLKTAYAFHLLNNT